MNLAIRGIDGQIAQATPSRRPHRDLKPIHPRPPKFFFIPRGPFNISDGAATVSARGHRWKTAIPPTGNAIRLVQTSFTTSRPMALRACARQGSLSSKQSGEGGSQDLTGGYLWMHDSLPRPALHSTRPACFWFLAPRQEKHKFRERRGTSSYRRRKLRGNPRPHNATDRRGGRPYSPTYTRGGARRTRGNTKTSPGFARAPTLDRWRNHGHVLTPGRYVVVEGKSDGGAVQENDERFTTMLRGQNARLAN
jgi:type I restriction enzyme M protein